MVMSASEVHNQHLHHRVVLTMLYDSDGRIYLQRRAKTKKSYPGMWELSSTGHVQAGESCEDAALRELREELDVHPGKVHLQNKLPASFSTDYAWISLFSARFTGSFPTPNPEEVSEGMFVDREELLTMLEHFREMLTPALIWAIENNQIFPKSNNK